MSVVDYGNLGEADLIIDAVYQGDRPASSYKADPLNPLLGVGNSGGFRIKRDPFRGVAYCVLYSTLLDLDWPDELDSATGVFTYYGDNRKAGHELHEVAVLGHRPGGSSA